MAAFQAFYSNYPTDPSGVSSSSYSAVANINSSCASYVYFIVFFGIHVQQFDLWIPPFKFNAPVIPVSSSIVNKASIAGCVY
jgi:hypothetical protein